MLYLGKETCSWKLQVCFSVYDHFVDTPGIKGLR